MSIAVVVLRLVHILASIVWLGGAFLLVAYVMPTAKRTGADGARFMQSLVGESGLTKMLAIASWLSTLAGLALFDFVSGHFSREYMRSAAGMTLSTGMTFGLLAFLHGAAVQGVTARKLGKLGRTIAAAGGPPSAEQLAQLTALRDKLARGGLVMVVLLTLAAAAMAIARYV